jgi:hypothetical protein
MFGINLAHPKAGPLREGVALSASATIYEPRGTFMLTDATDDPSSWAPFALPATMPQ